MKSSQEFLEKILIVDSDKAKLEAMKTMLANVDAEIHEASSGNSALSFMIRNDYALVITALTMPKMDGCELLQLMREFPTTVNTPVFMVSDKVLDNDLLLECYENRVIDIMQWPVNEHVIQAKAKVFVSLSSQSNTSELKSSLDKSINYNLTQNQTSNSQDDDKAEKQKILIVDDLEENLYALEVLLRKLDLNIYKASSGMMALDLLKENQFSLILLDVQMPEMDGFEVAKRINDMNLPEAIPIIFVTAISKEHKHVYQGYESGAIDYIFKPIEPAILLAKVSIFMQLYNHRHKLKKMVMEKNELLEKVEAQNTQLGYLAYHDPLTKCANRAGFENKIVECLSSAKRYSRMFALILIDLDHFKVINDVYGHDYGDAILQKVVDRLQDTLRTSDFVARLGGDEFSVILDEINSFHGAGKAAQNIIDSLTETYVINNKKLRIGASIGIACYPNEHFEDEIEASAFIKNADIAMYRAKQRRNNSYEYFSSEFSQQHQERTDIENSLKFALEKEELFLGAMKI